MAYSESSPNPSDSDRNCKSACVVGCKLDVVMTKRRTCYQENFWEGKCRWFLAPDTMHSLSAYLYDTKGSSFIDSFDFVRCMLSHLFVSTSGFLRSCCIMIFRHSRIKDLGALYRQLIEQMIVECSRYYEGDSLLCLRWRNWGQSIASHALRSFANNLIDCIFVFQKETKEIISIYCTLY